MNTAFSLDQGRRSPEHEWPLLHQCKDDQQRCKPKPLNCSIPGPIPSTRKYRKQQGFITASKQAEIEQHIDGLTARLSNARADLLHVASTMRLFDPAAIDDRPTTSYQGGVRTLRRAELFERCKTALAASPEALSTRELVRQVIAAEAWDLEDKDLRLTVAHRVGSMMARFERRGLVKAVGERSRVTLWRLA